MKCPVCFEEVDAMYVESHTDPIEEKKYDIYLCPVCEVEFSNPMKNPGSEWYRKFNECWGGSTGNTLLTSYRTNFLARLCRMRGESEQPKLLDIGCGYGDFLLAAKKVGYEVTGVDFDQEKVEIAHRKVGYAHVRTEKFEEFYNENRKEEFDVITFFQVLEHVEDPNIFLEMVRDMLKPAGYIILDVPNAQRILKISSDMTDRPPHHLTRWKLRSLCNFLNKKGFKVTTTTTTVYPVRQFYDNLFLAFSTNFLAFFKKLVFGGRHTSEFRTIPLSKLLSSQGTRNGEKTSDRFFARKELRVKILRLCKILYYLTVVPLTIILAYPLLVYSRRKGKGQFIFLAAKKE